MKTLNEYDAFEMAPVVREIDGTMRRCEDDEHPDLWTVFGHMQGVGVEELADCYSPEVAMFLGYSLSKKYGVQFHTVDSFHIEED